MKILFLHTFYTPHIGGGAEVVLRHTAEGLRQRGIEVCVLATGPDKGLHDEMLNGVHVYRAGLINFYWHYNQTRPNPLLRLGWHMRDRYNRGMRRYVRQVIEREQPDIVVTGNLPGWSISAWDEISAAGLPIVQVLHDFYLLCPRDTMCKGNKSCEHQCGVCAAFRRPHAKASEQVTAVIGVSRYVLRTIVEHNLFRAASLHVVHNSTPVGASAPPPDWRGLRDGGALRFGYIGMLSQNKGVSWLIDQFQRLQIDATLDIAGRGKAHELQELTERVTSSAVRFVGYRNPDQFLRSIDVLVVPSIWGEPFGLVAAEACAHGVPVIASRMGGLPEIIQHEVNGLLCKPDEPDSLGQAMERLYLDSNLRKRLASQARSSVAPLLDMDRMLDEYETIIHQTLQRRSNGYAPAHLVLAADASPAD